MDSIFILNNFNVTKIEDNIYLGDEITACDKEFLEIFQIKRILTILEDEIPYSKRVQNIYYKHVSVEDKETEDIMTYFPECFDFITVGQTYDENVFIHSQKGISRSPAVVIAFMMKKYEISDETAIQMLKISRQCIDLNEGFGYQLNLWQKMSHKIDINNRHYRILPFRAFKNKLKQVFTETDFTVGINQYFHYFEDYFYKLNLFEKNNESLNQSMTYYCLNCNNQLFKEFNVIKKSANFNCKSIYIEPMEWMVKDIKTNSKRISDLRTGTVNCVNCSKMLGRFDWRQSANVCNCPLHQEIDDFLVVRIASDKVIKINK